MLDVNVMSSVSSLPQSCFAAIIDFGEQQDGGNFDVLIGIDLGAGRLTFDLFFVNAYYFFFQIAMMVKIK